MATAQDVLNDWAGEDGERYIIFHKNKGLVLRWLNEAQLRFCDLSEIFRGVWSPIISSDGVVSLPDDFLREVPHTIKWAVDTPLTKIDYAVANLTTFSGTYFYSIWGGKFYVWTPAEGTPSIPYFKKPSTITNATLANDDLEIPTEYHSDVLAFLEAKYQQRLGDYGQYLALMSRFDGEARRAGVKYASRNDPVPFMLGGSL